MMAVATCLGRVPVFAPRDISKPRRPCHVKNQLRWMDDLEKLYP